MTYKEFKKKYNGKYVDYDGACGYQCWDLGQKYFTECLGVPASVLGGCGIVNAMLYPPKRKQLDKYFYETKSPKQGDVAIWEYGHIAIYDSKNKYFSQNPNPCKVIKITRGGVHYFRLKSSDPKTISYRTHHGGKWQGTKVNGQQSGNGKRWISAYQIKSNVGPVYYRSHLLEENKWLSEVKKWDDTPSGFAGIIGKKSDAIMVKTSYPILYRVKTKKHGWLSWVSGYDTKDANNGYAGIMNDEITALEIKFK